MNEKTLNGVALAYLGDTFYELQIRSYLLEKGFTKVNELHKKAIHYTSGKQQAKAILTLINESFLNETEINYFKKGRNASGPGRKNIDQIDYHHSTGFEAMIGFLYLTDIERAKIVIHQCIEILERED